MENESDRHAKQTDNAHFMSYQRCIPKCPTMVTSHTLLSAGVLFRN